MSLLTENPWPLVYLCAVIAIVSLVLLRMTTQGKFLVVAMATVVAAAGLLATDVLVVTDVERVESVVEGLVRATSRSDSDAVIAYLDPEVAIEQQSGEGPVGELLRGKAAHLAIRATLATTRFDQFKIDGLQASAGSESRQGKADFGLIAGGSIQGNPFHTGPEGSSWSLGLREAEPGVWKVTRITAVRLPGGATLPLINGPR